MSQDKVAPQIEGDYCCMKGYLDLCKARGQTHFSMAVFLGVRRRTVTYHYQKLRAGEYVCPGGEGCLREVIEAISSVATLTPLPPES